MKRCICFLAVTVIVHAVFAADYDVRSYGAKGDTSTKDTAAIQRAIDAAAAAGGGRVVVPPGSYQIGSIYLKDNIELHVEKGAVLFGSPDKADYNAVDICPQNWASKSESASGAHLILAIERRNVSITGEGCIDGNCRAFLIAPHVVYKQVKIPWRPSQMIYFVQCDGVRLENFHTRNAPYWTCFLFGCRDVKVKGLTMRQMRYPHTHNGDGLDIDACERVTVEDCDIVASDDALTLRACSRRLTRPMECRDVTVRNCRLSSACTAIRIGVGDGVIRDCSIKGVKIWRTRSGFDLVSSWSKNSPGTSFINLTIEDVEMEAVRFLTFRRNTGSPDRKVDGITFRNIRCRSEMPSFIYAGDDPNGQFGMIAFENVDAGQPIEIRGVKRPVLTGGTLRTVSFTEEERSKNEEYYLHRRREYWHMSDIAKPNPVRVEEIAECLGAAPGLPGDHISNREEWKSRHLTDSERGLLKRTGSGEADLAAMTVAECVENKGRYLPEIAKRLEVIAVQPDWNFAPEDQCLATVEDKRKLIDPCCARSVLVLATTLDRLRGRLPEATVARVRAEMDRRVFKPYIEANEGKIQPDDWFFGKSSLNAICHGAIVQAALRVVEDRTLRARFFEAAERANKLYLESFLPDGTPIECQERWTCGFVHFLDNVARFRAFSGGKVDFALDPVGGLALKWFRTLKGANGQSQDATVL